MEDKILQEAGAHAREAREQGNTPVKVTLKSGETSSLGKMIQTKEQADLFMKMLKALYSFPPQVSRRFYVPVVERGI